jgi:hypothetical protein
MVYSAICASTCIESLKYVVRHYPTLIPTDNDIRGVTNPHIIKVMIEVYGSDRIMPYVKLIRSHPSCIQFASILITNGYLSHATVHPDSELQRNASTLEMMYVYGFGTHVLDERAILSDYGAFGVAQTYGYIVTPDTLTVAACAGCDLVIHSVLELLRGVECCGEVGERIFDGNTLGRFIIMTPFMIQLIKDNPTKLTIAPGIVCDIAGKNDIGALSTIYEIRKGGRSNINVAWKLEQLNAIAHAIRQDALECALYLIKNAEVSDMDVLAGFNKVRKITDNSTVIALRKIRTRAMVLHRRVAARKQLDFVEVIDVGTGESQQKKRKP